MLVVVAGLLLVVLAALGVLAALVVLGVGVLLVLLVVVVTGQLVVGSVSLLRSGCCLLGLRLICIHRCALCWLWRLVRSCMPHLLRLLLMRGCEAAAVGVRMAMPGRDGLVNLSQGHKPVTCAPAKRSS